MLDIIILGGKIICFFVAIGMIMPFMAILIYTWVNMVFDFFDNTRLRKKDLRCERLEAEIKGMMGELIGEMDEDIKLWEKLKTQSIDKERRT